jgi:hypothetical protein
MRITHSFFLVILGCCSAALLYEVPAHAQAPRSSTAYRPKASTVLARPSSSAVMAKRQAAPKPSRPRVQPQAQTTSRLQRPALKSSRAAVTPAPSQSGSFPIDNPFADNSTGLFDRPLSRTNAATLASTNRHQYYADVRSGLQANRSIPKIKSRRGGMGMGGIMGGMGGMGGLMGGGMGMGGMGMGGMGMGGMGMGGMGMGGSSSPTYGGARP